jgi:hypothetical protein
MAKAQSFGEIIEYSVPEIAACQNIGRDQAPLPIPGMLCAQTIDFPVLGQLDSSSAQHA